MSAAGYESILASDSTARLKRGAVVAVVVAIILVASYFTGLFDAQRFADAWPAVRQLSSEMFPPDFGRFMKWLRPLLDTLAMSIAGTAIAVGLSVPLALLAASNTTPNKG